MKKDYYQILNISNTATDLEIKRAYKKLAMKYHPDRNQGNKNAETKFKEVKEAYEILSDPKKRKLYEQYGHSAFEQNSSHNNFNNNFRTSTSDFSDIFGDVFGDIFGNTKKNKKTKGSDLQYDLELTLEEAVKGTYKEINIPTLTKCIDCYGTGSKRGTKPVICTNCHGNGQIHMQKGFFSVQQTCEICSGQGKIIKNPCAKCYGQGRIKKSKKLSIKIPSGIDTNDKIRLNNEGEAGLNGARSGDLYIQINVKKHPIFKREDNNLHCEVPINCVMAALGGEIEIPTLEGRINFKIPQETQSGKLFRIRGKGIRSVRNGLQGDLFCKIIVETPVNLNMSQKNLLHKLGKSFGDVKGKNNSPKSKRFFNSVKRFFDALTK
ncbi:molecular chaperone DnaJ [Buchnera aphidicola]|uniref:Chaperone protein DnaJ n=1 Tax=Buchnera aphidicola subsp. Tuberolachnus salignus TaxID=98804 RepID=A0A160SYS8_BUCTT|nr:molecular chaperone DnaJ [Buchnera aphidicola]CUR53086.1 Chaperone protein DnaJ [Buchnera aphidicola (Tuberolachnus salignus)]